MTALENLYTRRSIRRYRPEQITDEELEQVLKAGMFAPTGMNKQTTIIIAVQNREDVAELSRLNAAVWGQNIDPFYGAPTVLVVMAAEGEPNAMKDGSLVMGNLMNAAHAVGLGSCWINRAEEVFRMPEGRALLNKWGVEGNYFGVGNCILGYTDGAEPEPKPRKEHYVYYVR